MKNTSINISTTYFCDSDHPGPRDFAPSHYFIHDLWKLGRLSTTGFSNQNQVIMFNERFRKAVTN